MSQGLEDAQAGEPAVPPLMTSGKVSELCQVQAQKGLHHSPVLAANVKIACASDTPRTATYILTSL